MNEIINTKMIRILVVEEHKEKRYGLLLVLLLLF